MCNFLLKNGKSRDSLPKVMQLVAGRLTPLLHPAWSSDRILLDVLTVEQKIAGKIKQGECRFNHRRGNLGGDEPRVGTTPAVRAPYDTHSETVGSRSKRCS
jgi:hypothetical protein